MKQIEENVIHSFRLAKSDIIKLKNEVVMLSQTQERIMEMIDQLKSYEEKLYQNVKDVSRRSATPNTIVRTIRTKPKTIIKRVKSRPKIIVKKVHTRPKTVVKTVTKYAKKKYLASKEGKDFHIPHCPFALNIKPKTRIVFKTKASALNKGYKPRKCVK